MGKLKIVDVNGFSIATMNYENLCKQDAHLISASPALLQSCINAESLIGMLTLDSPMHAEFKVLHKELKAAIHKALNIQ